MDDTERARKAQELVESLLALVDRDPPTVDGVVINREWLRTIFENLASASHEDRHRLASLVGSVLNEEHDLAKSEENLAAITEEFLAKLRDRVLS